MSFDSKGNSFTSVLLICFACMMVALLYVFFNADQSNKNDVIMQTSQVIDIAHSIEDKEIKRLSKLDNQYGRDLSAKLGREIMVMSSSDIHDLESHGYSPKTVVVERLGNEYYERHFPFFFADLNNIEVMAMLIADNKEMKRVSAIKLDSIQQQAAYDLRYYVSRRAVETALNQVKTRNVVKVIALGVTMNQSSASYHATPLASLENLKSSYEEDSLRNDAILEERI